MTGNGNTTTRLIIAYGGITTSNLTVTGTTDLQTLTFTTTTGTSATTTNLFSLNGTTTNPLSTNAAGWGTGSYDFAEMFPSDDNLSPGDVVVVDPQNPEHVKKSTQPGESAIIGIVSTQAGFLAGENLPGNYPIALAGRVPTKVSEENGNIMAGDALAASSLPGVAMKASAGSAIVGIALEPYVGANSSTGSIVAFVHVGVKEYPSGNAGGAIIRKGFARIAAGSTDVTVSFDSIGAYPIVIASPSGQAGEWWIDSQSDTGFKIVMGSVQNHDVVFAWKAKATPAGTIEWMSDGTFVTLDPTSGLPI